VKYEVEITDLGPFFGSFLGFGDYVTGMRCQPMGLPMFRCIFFLIYIYRCLGNIEKDEWLCARSM
jgi:hypothetical protein